MIRLRFTLFVNISVTKEHISNYVTSKKDCDPTLLDGTNDTGIVEKLS